MCRSGYMPAHKMLWVGARMLASRMLAMRRGVIADASLALAGLAPAAGT